MRKVAVQPKCQIMSKERNAENGNDSAANPMFQTIEQKLKRVWKVKY